MILLEFQHMELIMNRKRLFSLFCALFAAAILFAQPVSEVPGTEEDTFLFTDDLGRSFTLPQDIQRVLPAGPPSQYILLPVAADRFTGLACSWSSQAEDYLDGKYYNLPVTGQIYGKKSSFNLEEVMKQDPQVIIDIGEKKKGIAENLDKLTELCGIPIVHIDGKISAMGTAYRKIGELLNRPEKAEDLALFCEKVYARAEEFAQSGLDSGLYICGAKGVNVIASRSFQAEVVNMLINNAADLEKPVGKGSGNEVDMEQILNWDPECLIFARDAKNVYENVKNDPVWSQMKAVKNNRVYLAPATLLNWIAAPPSVNRFLGLIWAPTVLYPERAGWDAKAEVKEYFRLFYHADLSDAQYEEITRQ